jgi:predicted glycoside hydrolase/deacetylase ChbG (UPF0249 family)
MTKTGHVLTTADDYGISSTVNKAIRQKVANKEADIVSVMANYVTQKELQTLQKIISPQCLSVHISLVEGQPISRPQDIPHLVNKKGELNSIFVLYWQLLFDQIPLKEIEQEVSAQVEKLIALGVQPHYIDSHQHTHTFMPIWKIFQKVRKKYNISSLRSIESSKRYLYKRPHRYLIFIFFHLLLKLRYPDKRDSTGVYHAAIIHPGSKFY